MILPNFETPDQVTDERVAYLTELAQTYSTKDDFTIQNFADLSIRSPDVQLVLQNQSTINLLGDVPPEGVLFDIFNPTGITTEIFALLLPQDDAIFPELWDNLKNLFSSLRRKVKRIFCKVVNTLSAEEELDLKVIIKQVLLVLIPALAASTGLMPIALSIVVSLAAMLIKNGVGKVCPV